MHWLYPMLRTVKKLTEKMTENHDRCNKNVVD